jgi:mannose-6-phosphate isomerase-like protein (cupin superfamily)
VLKSSEGEVNYRIDEEEVHLKAGDCLLYDGRIPHVPLNTSKNPAKMLVIYLYKQKNKF